MIIYKTTNLINNKIYVGKDSYNNPSYLGGGKLIKRSIKKYGRNKFRKEILETCNSEEELNKSEIYWIQKLNSTNPNIGYNLDTGGTGGRHSEETRILMSKLALKRDRSFYENKERNKKISEVRKGKKHSKETIIKMKKWHSDNREKITHQLKLFTGFTGRKRTNEFKDQLKKANSGINNPNSKIYYVTDSFGNEYEFVNRNLLIEFFNKLNEPFINPREMVSPNNLLRNGENKGWIVKKDLRK